jgi:hypothetical protein
MPMLTMLPTLPTLPVSSTSFLRRATSSRSLLASFLVLLGLSTAAGAATVTATATSTGRHPIDGTLTIDDGIDPGNLVITFDLDVPRGNIRGFLAQFADESLISGMSVVGYPNRASQFREDRIGKAAKSRGLGQPGSACPCDFGLKFPARTGTSVTFTLTHETEDLTLALFYGQDFSVKASKIRLEDLNSKGKPRSLKNVILEGRVPSPIPEPTTAVLMALGLGGLSYAGSHAGGNRKS